MKATRFLHSGPPEIEQALEYALSQESGIGLNEKDKDGLMKHEALIEKIPNIKEIDSLLFNEFIGMISGEKAEGKYITTNLNKGSRFMYIHKKAEISTRWT